MGLWYWVKMISICLAVFFILALGNVWLFIILAIVLLVRTESLKKANKTGNVEGSE